MHRRHGCIMINHQSGRLSSKYRIVSYIFMYNHRAIHAVVVLPSLPLLYIYMIVSIVCTSLAKCGPSSNMHTMYISTKIKHRENIHRAYHLAPCSCKQTSSHLMYYITNLSCKCPGRVPDMSWTCSFVLVFGFNCYFSRTKSTWSAVTSFYHHIPSL